MNSSSHTLTCLCTCSSVHWHTPLSVWQLPVHLYAFLCVWCGVIMALWVSCHWQTSCISWILNELVSSKVFLQKKVQGQIFEDNTWRMKANSFCCPGITHCVADIAGWMHFHCYFQQEVTTTLQRKSIFPNGDCGRTHCPDFPNKHWSQSSTESIFDAMCQDIWDIQYNSTLGCDWDLCKKLQAWQIMSKRTGIQLCCNCSHSVYIPVWWVMLYLTLFIHGPASHKLGTFGMKSSSSFQAPYPMNQ